ncbi:MAG: hypothetical protein ABI411_05035 [Tahibacter sp.]
MSFDRRVLALWLLFACCAQSFAQTCAPFVEEQAAWSTAMFRPHSNGMQSCTVSEEVYRAVVRDWLRDRAPALPPLTSLSLGRAENFPWLSHYLADSALQSANWRTRVLRAGAGEHNQFVADLLSEPAMLQRLDAPFAESAYRVVGASVEKVLAGKASVYASVKTDATWKVPFDAQVWLRLASRNPAGGR